MSVVEALTRSGGSESPAFLNDLVQQLWPNIAIAAGNIIKGIAEPMFKTMLPPPLNSLVFRKIDLGVVPMHFSNVDVHKTELNGIKLDLDVNWDGQCDIELGGNMIPKIGVEHVKLRGRLSILLCPLTNVLPLIGAAQVSFINPPSLDLDFTDAAHIANLSIIDKVIRKIILSIISSMAVLPNRFLVKLDPLNDWFKTFQHPEGVLRLTVESGSELGETKHGKNFLKKLVHDEPDCFVTVSVSAEEVWNTRTVENHRHPEWNETHEFLVSDYDEDIKADVKDQDTATTDDDIGLGITTVKKLLLAGGREELSLSHKGQTIDGKLVIRGEFFRFVKDAASFEGDGAGSEIRGLLTVLVASAFGVKGDRHVLKPSVKVTWGDMTLRTAIKTDCPGADIENPSFDQAFKIPVRAGMVPGGPPVRIALLDGEEERGSVEVPLEEVLGAPELVLEKMFDVGDGASVRAGIWLRGTEKTSLQG